jgi:hypothetical protein
MKRSGVRRFHMGNRCAEPMENGNAEYVYWLLGPMVNVIREYELLVGDSQYN